MHILFDLDGTLTDSGPGILRCARETFVHYGIPIPDDATMRTLVGPPLRQSFRRFGIPEEQMEEAIVHYRRLYTEDGGMYENLPYPGIEGLLQQLQADGQRLFVATSKPEHMAVDILEHFGLARYFECICGSLQDGVRDKKSAVISYLLEKIGGAGDAIMVGDTVFDVLGAAELDIPTVAVSWGYGRCSEMLEAGAVGIADTTEDLYLLLSK